MLGRYSLIDLTNRTPPKQPHEPVLTNNSQDYGCDKESTYRQPAVIEVHLDEPPKALSKSTAQTPKAKKSSRTTKAPKTTKSAATPGASGRDPNPIVRSRFNQDSPLTFSSVENTPRHGGGGFTPINSPSSRGGFTPVNSPSPNSQPARRKTAIRSTPQEAVTPEPTTASAGGSAVISSRGGTQPEHGYSLRRNRPRPTDPPAGKN